MKKTDFAGGCRSSSDTEFGYEAANGATALHAAVENGHVACVRALLDSGARQLASMEGASPIYIGTMLFISPSPFSLTLFLFLLSLFLIIALLFSLSGAIPSPSHFASAPDTPQQP